MWNFSSRGFHEIQFQCHFMKHKILSWNNFTLVSNIHCVCFSSIKNCVYWEMISCKIFKKNQHVSEWNHVRKPGATKVHVLTSFQNFRHYIGMNVMQDHAIDHTLTFIHWLLIILWILTLTILTQQPEQNS